MRHLLVALLIGSSALALTSWISPTPADQFQRALKADLLSNIRGADPENPTLKSFSCDNLNTGPNQVAASSCVAANVVCVTCSDSLLGATTGNNAQGVGFTQIDNASSSGQKVLGICVENPAIPNNFICQLSSWIEGNYCSKVIAQAIFQTPGNGD